MNSRCKSPGEDSLPLDNLSVCLHKHVLDLAHVGILVTNRAGDIKYLNPAYSRMFGMEIEEALTKNINDYFPNSAMMEVMKTGKPHKAVKFSHKGQNALISRHPIVMNGEVIGGLLEVYFRDINILRDLIRQMNILEKKVLYYQRKSQGLPSARYTFDDIIGDSENIRNFKSLGIRFANTSKPVLLLGESGTGKELVAHAIHSASQRAGEVFISVNCAAIPRDLLESELFGFEEGVFTGAKAGGRAGKFELADKGTVFLDEIGDLPLEMQAKLLRVIENGEIQKIGATSHISSDFRLIAATNKDLASAVQEGTFREDLYHRLNILTLNIPPLRERPGDVPLIAKHILNSLAEKPLTGRITFAPEVQQLFQTYAWPGNIRELKNVLSFAIFSLDEGQSEIRLRNLPPYFIEKSLIKAGTSAAAPTSLSVAREKSEQEALVNALGLANHNKAKAARILGISRNEIYKKMKKYGLTSPSA